MSENRFFIFWASLRYQKNWVFRVCVELGTISKKKRVIRVWICMNKLKFVPLPDPKNRFFSDTVPEPNISGSIGLSGFGFGFGYPIFSFYLVRVCVGPTFFGFIFVPVIFKDLV